MSPMSQIMTAAFIALCAIAGFLDYLNILPF